MVSGIVLIVMFAAVALGPVIWPVPINDIDFAAKLQGPSWAHPLGTDDLGQDLLARLLYGGRISLAVGLAAMVVAVVVGILVGALAGMSSGRVDAVLMWLTDLFLSLPQLPLLLLVIYLFRDTMKGIFGVEGGAFILIVVVIGGLRWMPVARLVRAQFLSLREKEFVEAARALGASKTRQFFSITIPLVTPTLFFVVITTMISTLQIFDVIYMMIAPKSAALNETQSIVVYFFRNAFEYSKKGYASAVAVFLFVIILGITAIQMKLQKKWVNYD